MSSLEDKLEEEEGSWKWKMLLYWVPLAPSVCASQRLRDRGMSMIALPEDLAQCWGRGDSPLCASWLAPHFFSRTPHRWTPPQRCEILQCSTGLGWRTHPGEPAPRRSPLQKKTSMFSMPLCLGWCIPWSHLPFIPKAWGIMSLLWKSITANGFDLRTPLVLVLTRPWHYVNLDNFTFFEFLSYFVTRE